MKKTSDADTHRQFKALRQKLALVGPISQGSVQDRTARKSGGAGYQWTRKIARKTVTVSLTREQYRRMKAAVGNYRQLRHHLSSLEKLSRRIIFRESPHPARRKKLSPKVLGIN